jgi:hypothetical protein
MNPKHVDIAMCEGCNVALLDYDECDSCIECEACGIMTPPQKLDPALLLEAEVEICTDCTNSWYPDEVINARSDSDWETKYPVTAAAKKKKNEEKPTMAGFNGE